MSRGIDNASNLVPVVGSDFTFERIGQGSTHRKSHTFPRGSSSTMINFYRLRATWPYSTMIFIRSSPTWSPAARSRGNNDLVIDERNRRNWILCGVNLGLLILTRENISVHCRVREDRDFFLEKGIFFFYKYPTDLDFYLKLNPRLKD